MKFTEESICIVVNPAGLIINRIVCGPETPENWAPGLDLTMHKETTPMAIGGTYINGVYTPPPEPEESNDTAGE